MVSSYRLRLFLSVDLAGSTSFKAGAGRTPASPSSPHPLWIVAIRKFYEAFPAALEKHFARLQRFHGSNLNSINSPKVWKTIGDEIVFCCCVTSCEHLNLCASAFIEALKEYGHVLTADRYQMDVKGTAWIAGFPAINMTATRARLTTIDYLQEEFELAADVDPSAYDFLGPEIDAGFRISKHSSPDKCAISIQLAWLLTRSPQTVWNSESFSYVGRDQLKGVINDRPYPIVCLSTERNQERVELRRKEARITGRSDYSVTELHSFLEDFLNSEGLEHPVLPQSSSSPSILTFPESYHRFRKQAELELKAIIAQDSQLSESGEIDDDASGQEELPAEITSAALSYTEKKPDN